MTFAKALRAILRQDPDVIMIGEIRDLETAQIAVQASLTGHLVLATLHTNDSAAAITRLLDMGIEPFLLSSSLLGVRRAAAGAQTMRALQARTTAINGARSVAKNAARPAIRAGSACTNCCKPPTPSARKYIVRPRKRTYAPPRKRTACTPCAKTASVG